MIFIINPSLVLSGKSVNASVLSLIAIMLASGASACKVKSAPSSLVTWTLLLPNVVILNPATLSIAVAMLVIKVAASLSFAIDPTLEPFRNTLNVVASLACLRNTIPSGALVALVVLLLAVSLVLFSIKVKSATVNILILSLASFTVI